MPSFLNKVFGYKKSEGKDTARPTHDASDNTLLDGKYEAIPPVLSPSASTFVEAQSTKDDAVFSLFKPKSRGVSQKSAQKPPGHAPYLTLRLPGPKESSDSRALDVVFEADLDSQTILGDAVIAAKRLNPLDALVLVRACSRAITERGLETPGIMHPHWISASPDVQRKLISLFIHSLDPQHRRTTLSPTPTSPTSALENELHFTRSPHDVAAVLRWALRHLSFENGHFGKDGAEWAWYNDFFHAERNASYPPNGFSQLLLPRLPGPHAELLTVTLSLVSSLASHAESNSISGSRLSKFWGIWLLVATRAEKSDDWSRFYARWERAGRILEHLFLARLREESLGQRLPTRLQELIKYYPYNKGPPATEDELLSRPRLSTRHYDALLVRVETLLTYGAEQPKQHPIRLLLEAFQLPIENPSGDDHVVLWNTLKTIVSEEATSTDPEGSPFTRVFVDETTQLLTLIAADNSVPTSPTLFTSPVTSAVSCERSSSFNKFLESSTPRSNTNNGSTPVSPTSPSSPVIADWAQFSLAGFGDTPPTQPLAARLDQDDDTEVTQPRFSRKQSRQRGKSRTGRRRSEDCEVPETPPSFQSKPEPSIVDTKLASVRVVQIDEAFIDFWSDAIVDPISADWPTFVICGLKQIPGAESLIRWLVVEQTYSHQQPQPFRVPSPDGHRGRSPRPSFRSDGSGFRINSMFSSARKRFSVFSKSATDLNRKSGGKTPITGELGEVLVEEEQTFPFGPPTNVDHHFGANAVVGPPTTGATATVADQPKMDISTTPFSGVPTTDPVPMRREEADRTPAATKASSNESTPQLGANYDSSPVLPRSSLKTPEEAVSVKQGSPQTPDVINLRVNIADSAAKIALLAADTSTSRPTQDTTNSTVLSEPTRTAENPAVDELRLRAERVRQGVVIDEDQLGELVARPADGDEHITTESTGQLSSVAQLNVTDCSREVAEAVTMASTPETVAVLMTAPIVSDGAPEHIAQEPHVTEQSSRKAPSEFLTASTVGQYVMDKCPPVSAPNIHGKATAIETGAHLEEPDSIASVVDRDEEDAQVAEHVEIPTLASVALVEASGPKASVGACAHAGAAQHHAAEPSLQPVAAESQATLKVEEELADHPVEEFSVAVVSAVDTRAQVAAVETEHAADQASEFATEEVQPLVQGAIVQAFAEAPLVGAILAPDVNAYVSAAQDVAPTEAEAQAATESFVSEVHIVKTHDTGAPTPVLETVTLVDDTPGPEITAGAYEPIKAVPVAGPKFDVVEDNATEILVQAIMEANAPPINSIPSGPSVETEPPTQFTNARPADVLLAQSNQEAPIAVLGAADETIVLEAEIHAMSISENVPIKDANEPTQLAPSTAADPEPVAQDVQVPIENKESSNEPASQSVDEATSPYPVAVPAPEEISSVKVDRFHKATESTVLVDEIHGAVDTPEFGPRAVEPGLVEAGAPAAVVEEAKAPVEAEEPSPVAVEVVEEVMTSQSEAPAVETRGVDDSPEVVDLAE